jgi:hypothetical protein
MPGYPQDNQEETEDMAILTKACNELFRRKPDEIFASLPELTRHCEQQKQESLDIWKPPAEIRPRAQDGNLELTMGDDGVFRPNNWSFGQLCSLARVSRDTVNKVCAQTAVQILEETLPRGSKPLQLHTMGERLRSIHGATYTRLHNADVLAITDCAEGFEPPQGGDNGGTGLYCGEEDLFVFLIDPTGWTEINGEPFAPGFFLWNSEVGRRTVGVQTFWFQAICRNHIVWDAVEVVEFSRRHTANVRDSLDPIRDIIGNLAAKRDERRDGFVKVMKKAMTEKLGADAEEVMKLLCREGFSRNIAREALDMAKQQGAFTIFSLVDALTRIASRIPNAGDRTELDTRSGKLLALAA